MVQESIKHFPIPLKLRKEESLSPADGGTKFLVLPMDEESLLSLMVQESILLRSTSKILSHTTAKIA